ncbi:MAG: hypothetical protein M3R38_12725 [Actinomycetota bacterium]|nr:hypothetical protein [Actinomycetota bacterium]
MAKRPKAKPMPKLVKPVDTAARGIKTKARKVVGTTATTLDAFGIKHNLKPPK